MSPDIISWIQAVFTAVLACAAVISLRYNKSLVHFTKTLALIEDQREKWVQEERTRVEKALLDELDTNYFLLDQKIDILKKMLSTLEKSEIAILSGISVHAATIIYDSHISAIYTFLDSKQRDNLHVIYQHLKQNDIFMDSFERNYKTDLGLGIFKDIAECREAYKRNFRDSISNCDIIKDIISHYMAGNPRDVFPRPYKK